VRKKLLMILGFGSTLALAVALATDKAQPSAEKEVRKAAITTEGHGVSGSSGKAGGQAYDCQKPESQCLRKKSGSVKAQPSSDQNVASTGIDCPKSADCPKADCDRSMCLKKGSQSKHREASAEDASHPATDI
jgi:hypothetical protein